MLEVTRRIRIPLREIQFEYSRASGPGGQNVNKVSSRATLRWKVTTSPSIPEAVRQRFLQQHGNRVNKDGEVLITGGRYRDQGRNVADVMERLRQMLLAVAKAPKRRKKTRPVPRRTGAPAQRKACPLAT